MMARSKHKGKVLLKSLISNISTNEDCTNTSTKYSYESSFFNKPIIIDVGYDVKGNMVIKSIEVFCGSGCPYTIDVGFDEERNIVVNSIEVHCVCRSVFENGFGFNFLSDDVDPVILKRDISQSNRNSNIDNNSNFNELKDNYDDNPLEDNKINY